MISGREQDGPGGLLPIEALTITIMYKVSPDSSDSDLAELGEAAGRELGKSLADEAADPTIDGTPEELGRMIASAAIRQLGGAE